jgi:hypothetical protein
MSARGKREVTGMGMGSKTHHTTTQRVMSTA